MDAGWLQVRQNAADAVTDAEIELEEAAARVVTFAASA